MPIDATILNMLKHDKEYPTLTTLDLHYGGNYIKGKLTTSDIAELVEALQNNTVLKTLNIDFNDLGDNAIILLVKNLKHVKELSARDNLISPQGAKAIAANSTFIKINIHDNKIGDEGAKAFAENHFLRKLNIGNNDITNKGICHFAHNVTLDVLYIGNNRIHSDGIATLLQNDRLTKIYILGNSCDAEVTKQIHAKVKFNKQTQINNRQNFLTFLMLLTKSRLQTPQVNWSSDNYFTQLPLEIILHTLSYLALSVGKNQAQTTACVSFILTHAAEFAERLKTNAGIGLKETAYNGSYQFKFFKPSTERAPLPLNTQNLADNCESADAITLKP